MVHNLKTPKNIVPHLLNKFLLIEEKYLLVVTTVNILD